MFEGLYGLSCVEDQVLAILKERGNDIAPFYHHSAISLKELFFFMVIKGESPYRFSRMPKIQDELKQMEILDIHLKTPQNMRSVRDKIRNCKENEYVLIRVTPEFTRAELHARGFRKDHFVKVTAQEKDFVIYNDIPETTAVITAAKLGKIYDGEYLLITEKGKVDERLKQELWNNRIFKAEKHIPFYFRSYDLEGIENIPARMRNMIQVYKIMRCRLAEYYGQYVNTEFVKKSIPMIEKYYAKAEYFNLRKNATMQQWFELLHNVNVQDVELMDTLKGKLEEK